MRKYWKSILWSILIMVAILIPKDKLPDDNFLNIKHFDKIVHFLMFGGLEFLLLIEGKVQAKPGVGLYRYTLMALTYGGITELIQLVTHEGRTASWFDYMADVAGISAAIVFFSLTINTKLHSFLREY